MNFPAPKTLIGIARVSRDVFDTLVKHGSGRTVESFQLERIVVASGAIVETLNKALLLGRGNLDARLLDWLVGEEPKTCLDVLSRMEALLSPKRDSYGMKNLSLFQSSRHFASTKDKRDEAIKLFWEHESYFHFLLSTEVWNHESDVRQKTVEARPPEVLRMHEASTRSDLRQHEVGELPSMLEGETEQVHTTTQERKTRKQGFSAKKVDGIVRWLSAWSCKETHERIFLLQQPDTCAWLPNTSVYKMWRNKVNSFLWLHGKPGAGKSVLAASVIGDLERSLHDGEVLAYFYCDFRNERSTNAAEAMRSLLSQLLQQFRHHTPNPGNLIDELAKQKGERAFASAMTFARYIPRVAKFLNRQPYLVIDALDECNDVEELLGAIEELNKGGVRLFVTSRPLQVIKERFQNLPLINMDMMGYETSADIKLHVARELDSHRRLRILDTYLKDEIESVLCEKANGMFRWVQCQLNLIKRCVTAVQIRDTLNNLPSSLNETYDRIIFKISEDADQSKIARRALDWLVVSLLPLRLSQIMEGLSIDPVGRAVDRESAPVHGPALLDVLGSLVSYNEVTDIVILSHFSVKEYLTAESARGRPSAYHVDEQAAHTQMALVCICYIGIYLGKDQRSGGHEAFPGSFHETRRRPGGSEIVARSTKYPRSQLPSPEFHSFDEYALFCGFRHLAYINRRNRVILRAIESLHSISKQHPSRWNQLWRRSYPTRDQVPTLEHDVMLYILIAFCPEPLFRSFLGHTELKLKDGTNPLIYAAHLGKIEHARTLLLKGIKLNRTGLCLNDTGQVLPLEAAVESGDCDVVDLFLAEGSHVPHKLFVHVLKPSYCHLPARIVAKLVQTDQFAEWAIDGQDEEMLLRALDSTRYRLVYSERPSEQDFDIIKRRLIQLGYDPSARLNEASLRRAVSAGHISAVQHMLSLNIPFPPDIILDASRSTTPNAEMIRFCLDMGADIQVASPTGNTPLHLAFRSPHFLLPDFEDILLENIQALVDAGCNASRCNLAGETPLHLAVMDGYISIAEYLLSLSISLPPDILLGAFESRKPSMFRLLMSKGASTHAFAANGDTPLHRALGSSGSNSEDCLDYVKALMDAGCNPCIANADGKTPFDIAAENDHLLVVQYLQTCVLSSPVPPDILLSVVGSSPLRKMSTIKFLINNGASIHVARPNGDTLLHLALTAVLETDCLNETKFLVNAGCDPRARNLSGETSFHVAAKQGFTSVMEYLLSLGLFSVPSDIMITQFQEEHVLPQQRRRHATVRFLLDVGGNVHTVAKNGDTLLHLAAKLGPEEDVLELVKYLVHAGCNPGAFNSLQETPLHVAAKSGFISVIKYLLSFDTPLPGDILLAASAGPCNKMQLIRYLIQEGVSICVVTKNKDTPLHLLLVEGEEDDRLECIKILIDAGCDPQAENLAVETPLHGAARRESNKILEYFLSRGIPVPSNILLFSSTTTTIRYLLNKGLDFCAVATEGVTELMQRMLETTQDLNDSVEFARTLISAGWDPSLKNSVGETAIHFAAKNGNLNAVKFFLSQHVLLPPDILLTVAAPAKNDWRTWERAIALTRFFVSEGTSVNVAASNGDTPLHLAIMCNFSELNFNTRLSWRLVEVLLDSGSDPSARNADGKTPFDLAEAKGHFFKENFLRLVRNSDHIHRV